MLFIVARCIITPMTTSTTWRLAGSLDELRKEINAAYPNRSTVSDGTIGDAAHQAVPSDHNPNAQGVVCALDITHDPAHLDAHALADRLLAVRHPDLKYLISNRRIAGAWTNWQWTAYSGTSDPHINHIHVSVGVGDDGASTQPYDDLNKWNVTDQGVDDMKMTEGLFRRFWSMEGLDIGPEGRQPTLKELKEGIGFDNPEGRDVYEFLDWWTNTEPVKRQREKAALFDNTVAELEKNDDTDAETKLAAIKKIVN